ncbi:hypothetical protein PVAP13_5NG110301 [Panicum virgatum]|uniref:Uncharacterized protein n=1 Tax=Panicum virgatum TaxID=38727 RepID=A0A8T0S7U5_PANVG|nr:hypothetical protein PVAP13_5NG110301 [Panicum virgatum]
MHRGRHFANGGEKGCKNTFPLSSNAFGDSGGAAQGRRGARPAGGGGDDPAPLPFSLLPPLLSHADDEPLVPSSCWPARWCPPLHAARLPSPGRRRAGAPPRSSLRRRPTSSAATGERSGGGPSSRWGGGAVSPCRARPAPSSRRPCRRAPQLPPRAATAAERRSCSLEPARRHRRSPCPRPPLRLRRRAARASAMAAAREGAKGRRTPRHRSTADGHEFQGAGAAASSRGGAPRRARWRGPPPRRASSPTPRRMRGRGGPERQLEGRRTAGLRPSDPSPARPRPAARHPSHRRRGPPPRASTSAAAMARTTICRDPSSRPPPSRVPPLPRHGLRRHQRGRGRRAPPLICPGGRSGRSLGRGRRRRGRGASRALQGSTSDTCPGERKQTRAIDLALLPSLHARTRRPAASPRLRVDPAGVCWTRLHGRRRFAHRRVQLRAQRRGGAQSHGGRPGRRAHHCAGDGSRPHGSTAAAPRERERGRESSACAGARAEPRSRAEDAPPLPPRRHRSPLDAATAARALPAGEGGGREGGERPTPPQIQAVERGPPRADPPRRRSARLRCGRGALPAAFPCSPYRRKAHRARPARLTTPPRPARARAPEQVGTDRGHRRPACARLGRDEWPAGCPRTEHLLAAVATPPRPARHGRRRRGGLGRARGGKWPPPPWPRRRSRQRGAAAAARAQVKAGAACPAQGCGRRVAGMARRRGWPRAGEVSRGGEENEGGVGGRVGCRAADGGGRRGRRRRRKFGVGCRGGGASGNAGEGRTAEGGREAAEREWGREGAGGCGG